MDWGMLLTSMVISFILTIFAYLFVPIILALQGKIYEVKKLRKIIIINCAVVWILFRMLQAFLGDDITSGGAVFLWGPVGYWILKKHCLKHTAKSPGVESEQVFENSNKKTNTRQSPFPRHCSRCGHVIDQVTKKCTGCGKQYFKFFAMQTFLIAMDILFIASFTMNIVFYLSNDEMKNTISNLENSNAALASANKKLSDNILELKEENTNLQSKILRYTDEIEFYDECVVFIEDDGTKYYHNYDCRKFIGESFWAYNTEAAQSKGYKPCPDCCN